MCGCDRPGADYFGTECGLLTGLRSLNGVAAASRHSREELVLLGNGELSRASSLTGLNLRRPATAHARAACDMCSNRSSDMGKMKNGFPRHSRGRLALASSSRLGLAPRLAMRMASPSLAKRGKAHRDRRPSAFELFRRQSRQQSRWYPNCRIGVSEWECPILNCANSHPGTHNTVESILKGFQGIASSVS